MLVANDVEGSPVGGTVVFDSSFTPDTTEVYGGGVDGRDLTIISSSGDGVTITDELSGAVPPIQSVTFADGTVWRYEQLLSMCETGAADRTSIYGDSGANVLDSRGYASYAQGNGGFDTFIYNQGYGSLEISEIGPPSDSSVLEFGPGIGPASMQVTGDIQGNIYLSDGLPGDTIQLDGFLNGSSFGPQTIRFAGGTSWSRADVMARELTGTADAPDRLYGSSGADYLDGKGGNDYLYGGGGNNVFYYQAGYGTLEIMEDGSPSDASVLHLGPHIVPTSVQLSSDGFGNLILTDYVSTDQITIDNFLTSPSYGPQAIEFDDGVKWSRSVILAHIDSPFQF